MARKKAKTTKVSRRAGAKKKAAPRAKAAKPKPAQRRAGGKTKSAAESDVERRWNEYWASRTTLEQAVEQVKDARAALATAQDAERACRSEFEEIKRSLTELLDVEPAGVQGQLASLPSRSSSSSW